MGAVTHYLCEGLRAELPSHAKPLFLAVLVLTLFPPLRTLTHLHRHMFSDVRVPLCRLYLCALSSSSPCVFFLVLLSAALLPFGMGSGQRGTWLSTSHPFPAQPVGLVNWGNV